MLRELVDRIEKEQNIDKDSLKLLLTTEDRETMDYLHARARERADQIYGKQVLVDTRGMQIKDGTVNQW